MIALPRDRRLPLTAANTLPSWRVTICAKISLLQHPKQLYCVLLIFRCPQNSLWCRLLELGALLPLTSYLRCLSSAACYLVPAPATSRRMLGTVVLVPLLRPSVVVQALVLRLPTRPTEPSNGGHSIIRSLGRFHNLEHCARRSWIRTSQTRASSTFNTVRRHLVL